MKIRTLILLSAGISLALISCLSNPDEIQKKSVIPPIISNRSQVKTPQLHTLQKNQENKKERNLRFFAATGYQTSVSSVPDTGSAQGNRVDAISVARNLNNPRVESFSQLQKEVYPIIVRNPMIESYIWPFRKLIVSLDNDLFSNTDRYYTNGIHIILYNPSLAFSRINSILPVNMNKSIEFNSIELHHAMYTPFSTKLPPVLKDDRPYASTLFVRFKRRTDTQLKRYTQSASVDIGVIGNAALGSYLQKGVHASLPTNDEPLGWETQIGNDIIVNYNYEVTKEMIQSGALSASAFGTASLGTLNTSAEGGLRIRISNTYSLITMLDEKNSGFDGLQKGKWHFSFDAEISARTVGYNATLSGGFLNKNNYFVLMPDEIQRFIVLSSAGLSAGYGRYGISVGQYYISKEFKEGKNHFWGQIAINIDL